MLSIAFGKRKLRLFEWKSLQQRSKTRFVASHWVFNLFAYKSHQKLPLKKYYQLRAYDNDDERMFGTKRDSLFWPLFSSLWRVSQERNVSSRVALSEIDPHIWSQRMEGCHIFIALQTQERAKVHFFGQFSLFCLYLKNQISKLRWLYQRWSIILFAIFCEIIGSLRCQMQK